MKLALLLLVTALTAAGCMVEAPTANSASLPPTGSPDMEDVLQSDSYKAAVEEEMRRMAEEDATLEPADWIGKTGLPEDIEREVPRYLRRELGQALQDTDSLRASHLAYVGSFPESPGLVHFWRLPAVYSAEPTFVYVTDDDDVFSFGWSDRTPPDP